MTRTLKIPLLLFLFQFCVMAGFAQNTYKDSINNYFAQIQNLIKHRERFKEDFLDQKYLLQKMDRVAGNEKVATLLKLCSSYIYKSTDTARAYNGMALQLSKEIEYKKGEYGARFNEAYLLFVNGQFDQSMELIQETARFISVTKYPEVYADVHTLTSYIHTEKGEFDMALEEGLKLLDIGEKMDDEYILMRAYSSLSHYYLRIKNYRESLSYCLKGLHYVIQLKKTQYIYPKIDEIARMSAKLNDIDGALKAYKFYVDIEKKMPPPGNYIQSIVYMNMADIFITNGELEKAQGYLSRAMKMNYENKFRFRVPRALILQAELYLKIKDTASAISSYEKSIEAAKDINAFDVMKTNSGILTNLYEKTGQPSMAHEYRTLNQAIKDSLFDNEQEQHIKILETQRKVKEIMQVKRILELENEAQEARYNTILAILIFMLISSFIVVFSYIKVKEKNKLLYRQTIELTETQIKMRNKLQHEQVVQNTVSDADNDGEDAKLKSTKAIDKDVKEIILSRLDKLEQENFYIDQNCCLNQLAQQLKTNPKYLSQIINREKKMSFTNYINELRINHLLSRLLEDEEFRNSKLSYIAASIGYNNLNTFNTAFKKKQGILPSYFIKELVLEQKG